jgi:nitrogen fixation/metabolism regulation signal transduction histidine kinase
VATTTSYYATLLLLAALLIGQVVALARYVERTNRELGRFLSAIRHADFSQSFSMDRPSGSFAELGAAFEDILQRFRNARTQKEEQASYLDTLMQHIPIAVIAFDSAGRVDLFNNAARRLLRVASLRNISDYTGFGETFPGHLRQLAPGRSQLVEVSRDDLPLKLNVAATELRMSGRILKIVTLQDIRRELEARELATWQDLIRVLTHEIMNSVTPISSLATTAAGLLNEVAREHDHGVDTALADARDAVDTIATRSAGLLRFAQSYRRLTRVPAPVLRTFPVRDLFSRIRQLMEAQVARRGSTFSASVTPPALELTADADLLEQALLNLVKNAIDAVAGQAGAEVRLTAELGSAGQVVVCVSDDGIGMSERERENLFIPFYTTKRDGTGVGLSLVQQIMRAHHGSVAVTSEPGAGTTVRLRF